MKIVQLIYSLSSGGAERFIVSLSNQLVKNGHEVYLCILRPDTDINIFNKKFLDSSVYFESLQMSEGFSISKVLTVERYIKRINPDVVHCHLNVIPYIYRLSLINKRIKFFHTLHNLAPKTYSGRIQYLINKYLYAHNYIRPITISSECKASYVDTYHLDNVGCVINGCDKVSPSPKFTEVSKEIKIIQGNSECPIFVHVGRFHIQKNQSLLIRAFNRLRSDGYDYKLLIIGAGFDSPEAVELKEMANPNILFIGEKSNVGDYLLNSNYFVLSSLYEGLPISLLEAMSCGLICISTPAGGVRDVINDSEIGFLSEDFTIDSFYTTLKSALQYRNSVVPSAVFSHYVQGYSMNVCADKYQKLYTI